MPKPPRLFDWIIATALLAVMIWILFPQQLGVSLYKLSLVSMAGVVGYWLDRSLFPYARPDSFAKQLDTTKETWVSWNADFVFAVSMLRRAIIVGCAMLAMGLGA